MEFKIIPIGFVKKPSNGRILLEIDSMYWDATLELDRYSHIHVIWWPADFDQPEHRLNLQSYP
ncbi:MAG: tRNA (N6-threonylcarbamoyladenosine(37)-N6)-methyltransferase TrmO, partial [Candidatus Thorarchaeota archaeon]